LIIELYEQKKMTQEREHMALGSFREALTNCFVHFELTAKFLGDLGELKIFFTLYCSIVSECPLVFTASKGKLKYIKMVELTGVKKGLLVKEWPLINWKLTFHDGHTMNWGFHLG
jgi:hypothetical protein